MTPDKLNRIVQTITAFGSITAVYTTMVDLGKTIVFDHLMLDNATDESVTIKLTNAAHTTELIIPAGYTKTFDDFRHWDLVQIKRTSGAPTLGNFTTESW